MSQAKMNGQQARDRIREFLYQAYPVARKKGLADNTELLASGVIDSLGVLDLVHFLEGEFAIHVADEELVPENFQDLNQIEQFVQRRIAERLPAPE